MKKMNSRIYKWFIEHPLMISIAYFCFYFPIFWLLEEFREPEYFIHCALDDVIPFSEWFMIPYLMWFAFVPCMVLLFYFKSREDYFKSCKILYGGMTICLLIYFLFPTGLYLREPVEGNNILCEMVNALRTVDTPTNVCPSIHVSSTVGIILVLMHSERFSKNRVLKTVVFVIGSAICLSTVILDQHSVVDVVCGCALSITLGYLVEMSSEGSNEKAVKKIFKW